MQEPAQKTAFSSRMKASEKYPFLTVKLATTIYEYNTEMYPKINLTYLKCFQLKGHKFPSFRVNCEKTAL